MKKVITGGFLLIGGISGFCLWTIASLLKVEHGATTSVFGGMYYPIEWIILFIFVIITFAGLFLCLKGNLSHCD